jgi:hypothetical protein
MTTRAAETTPADAAQQAALLRLATLIARGAPEPVVFTAAAEEAARLLEAETSAVLRYFGAERAVICGT